MLRHEIAHGVVEMERNCNGYRCDNDADQPIKSGSVLHN
jgi:hypothetical protein